MGRKDISPSTCTGIYQEFQASESLKTLEELQSSEFVIDNEMQKLKMHFCTNEKAIAELNKMKANLKTAQKTSTALVYAYLFPTRKQLKQTMQILLIYDSSAH